MGSSVVVHDYANMVVGNYIIVGIQMHYADQA